MGTCSGGAIDHKYPKHCKACAVSIDIKAKYIPTRQFPEDFPSVLLHGTRHMNIMQ